MQINAVKCARCGALCNAALVAALSVIYFRSIERNRPYSGRAIHLIRAPGSNGSGDKDIARGVTVSVWSGGVGSSTSLPAM